MRDVTQDYLSTSRAWLQEQDISGGTLVIAVTEGEVETVTLEGHEENAIRMAFPRTEGRVLNLRDTEQGLEQLNRLNSRPLTVDILPGSREGFSRVTLVPVSQRFPVSLDVGADNRGQKSTGSRTLLRDGKQRLVLDVALSRRETENRLGGVRLDVSSPTLSSVTAGLSYSRSIGGGYPVP